MSQHLVTVASILQFLLAATFLIIPIVAYRHGTKAQRAAETQVESQGLSAELLVRHRIRFAESGAETLLPFAIALGVAALASLNLAGTEIGRVLSLAVQPLLLVGGGIVTAGQVFPVRFTKSVLKKSGDAAVRDLDVGAFVEAANAAFPGWLRHLVITRFLLVTAGSILVIILLVVA